MVNKKHSFEVILRFIGLSLLAVTGMACQVSQAEPITSTTPNIRQPVTNTQVTSILTNTRMEASLLCQQKFEKVVTKAEAVRQDSEVPDLILSFVDAGEYYLNHCLNEQYLIQDDSLEALRTLAQIMPETESCGHRYIPATQLLDLDGDGMEEIVLSSQLVRCDINYEHRGVRVGSGGINVIYSFEASAEEWQGYVLWPCKEASCLVNFGMQSRADIVLLPQRDKQGYPLVLLSASFPGGDGNTEVLHIGRWKEKAFDIIFSWSHRNWCQPFPAWKVTSEGHIFVPGVETSRPDLCPEGTKDALYVYENGEFVNQIAQ